MKLSDKIRTYRKSFDLSQEALAEKLNVSRQVITKWETDNGIPEISNLKALGDLFGVSIEDLLDDDQPVEYPLLREKYALEKNNYSNRYDYAVKYLKERYANDNIYGLTQVENGERPLLAKFFRFITLGVSDISYLTQWFSDLAIWFLAEKENRKLLIKVTKECIETRDISNIIDTDKFTYEKNKFVKIERI